MEDEIKEKIKLTTRQILLHFLDTNISLFKFFDRGRVYRKLIKEYWKWRKIDKDNFYKTIYRLKKQKLINVYTKGKEKYIELTPKGVKKLQGYSIEELKIKRPSKWDKKWRVVIFDIPNKKRVARDVLRQRLKEIGFLKLQESVFIFPFECKKEIEFLKELYEINPFVLYMVVDFLDTDVNLIKHFFAKNLLTEKMV